MPYSSDPAKNLAHGLSALWTLYFKDHEFLEQLFKGVNTLYAQAYLDLLNCVLAPGLKFLPIFDRKYFHLFEVRTDRVYYKEGASRREDRWVVQADDIIHDVSTLMNLVIHPTRVLTKGLHYGLVDNKLAFYEEPFSAHVPPFPSRSVTITAPAVFTELLGDAWTLGALPGDHVRIRIGKTTTLWAVLTEVDGPSIYLDTAPPELKNTPRTNGSIEVQILRTPFDTDYRHDVLDNQPKAVTQINPASSLVMLAGTTQFQHPSAVGAWVGKYVFIQDINHPENDGYAPITAVIGTTVSVTRVKNYVASSTDVFGWIVTCAYAVDNQPTARLSHTFLTSITVIGRRLIPILVNGVWWIDEPLTEGIDYKIDFDLGWVIQLSVWDPEVVSYADYLWLLQVAAVTYPTIVPWNIGSTYNRGARVYIGGRNYLCIVGNIGITPPNPSFWLECDPWPFTTEVEHQITETAFWSADPEFDTERLYEKFGHLVGFKRPSSEQYRNFLQGVIHLYVEGPLLSLLESALNVMAGFPVIMEEGETYLEHRTGIDASGVGGTLYGRQEGHDGNLSGLGTFWSLTASFLPTDVGAIIHVKVNGEDKTYIVTGVISDINVYIQPTPPLATSGFYWTFAHAVVRHFTVETPTFVPSDVGTQIRIRDANRSANVGIFTIETVENSVTVTFNPDLVFFDETGLNWELTRTGIQVIRTSRAEYELPFNIPISRNVSDPALIGNYIFKAFEFLTDVFRVDDYLSDPTWWHELNIPTDLLTLDPDTAGRRRVTALMIEHTVGPIDGARIGDPGLVIGVGDGHVAPLQRDGNFIWTGLGEIVLSLPSSAPLASKRDIGECFIVENPLDLKGFYRITNVAADGHSFTVARFPPLGTVRFPPAVLEGRLPPLLFRHTVAFQIVDQYLKYHMIRILVDPSIPLTGALIQELSALLDESTPTHVYAFVEVPTNFLESVDIAEDLVLTHL